MATVNIESLIKRKNGSRIQIADKTYHFKPTEEGGPHIAEVDEQHAKVLLSKPHGFARHGGDAAKAPAQTTAPSSDDSKPATITPADTPTVNTGSSHEKPTDAELKAYDEAVEAYKAKFHKRPHHTWTTEVIQQKLAAGE